MRTILIALALAAAAPACAQSAPPAQPIAAPARLSIDSTLDALAADPRTAAVLRRSMPGFLERMEESQDLHATFAGITLRQLSEDPHVRGMTPEVLQKLDALLAAAQAAAQAN